MFPSANGKLEDDDSISTLQHPLMKEIVIAKYKNKQDVELKTVEKVTISAEEVKSTPMQPSGENL